jgi:hypothetical protein
MLIKIKGYAKPIEHQIEENFQNEKWEEKVLHMIDKSYKAWPFHHCDQHVENHKLWSHLLVDGFSVKYGCTMVSSTC